MQTNQRKIAAIAKWKQRNQTAKAFLRKSEGRNGRVSITDEGQNVIEIKRMQRLREKV